MKEVLEYTLLLNKCSNGSGGSDGSGGLNNKITAFYHLIMNKIEKNIQ
jgi:glutamate 5-kinase